MSFQDLLEQLVKSVPGALGAVFADWEGERVDSFSDPSEIEELSLFGAHFGVVWNQSNTLFAEKGLGFVDELTIEAHRLRVLLRSVNERYYVVLTMRPDTHLANARKQLQATTQCILGEM
jgi:predicted regulator of Ras-like GTPase activity (Roadblock/LC7/MglB family)